MYMKTILGKYNYNVRVFVVLHPLHATLAI